VDRLDELGSPRPPIDALYGFAALIASLLIAGAAILAFADRADAAPPATFTTGFADPIYLNPLTANAWFDRTRAAGAQVVLLPVNWAGIAPQPPASGTDPSDPANPGYDWTTLDAAVRGATAHGLTVAFSVASSGGPSWADGPNRPASAVPGTWRPNASAFGAFARALARRYSGSFNPGTGTLPRVRYYQGWGEPNLGDHLAPQWIRANGRWVPESPVIYRGLLNAFYSGVKSVDRSDVVISAGTAPFGDPPGGQRIPPAEFVRELLCLHGWGLKPEPCPHPAHFDILAHHPYSIGGPTQPAINPDDVSVPDMWKLTRALKAAERSGRVLPRGPKRVWVTEFSWDSRPPDPNGVPVMKRARWLEDAFYILWKQGVDTITWYLIADQLPVPNYGSTYQSGIYFANGRPKPGLEAFRFPFVVASGARGRDSVWGDPPTSGTVLVQARRGRHWSTILRFHARTRRVFLQLIKLRGRPQLRARIGGQTSLSWRAP
jgi:hypothetical protein